MGVIIAFNIGICLGILVEAINVVLSGTQDRRDRMVVGIDPEALIAWIQSGNDNYEYIAPPTTSEIVKKIREMEGETWT